MAKLGYFERFSSYARQIPEQPATDLGIIVVIPCAYEPDLLGCLESLWKGQRAEAATEVILVINGSEESTEAERQANEESVQQTRLWTAEHADSRLRFHCLYFPNLPARHAGVGLARKIGMDEALRRFHAVERVASGVIVNLDADCQCEPNYLPAIEEHFAIRPATPGCSLYFQHPLGGELPSAVYLAAARYELHLRYYVQALRWAGHPHAFHTVGSAMAVRANIYRDQGGMNKRQAGEDFYFLHKIIPLGGYTDLNTTCVWPSPRASDRVPFGTGRAVNQALCGQELCTYPLEAFADIGRLNHVIAAMWEEGPRVLSSTTGVAPVLQRFLEEQKAPSAMEELRRNTASLDTFRPRFWRWFDGFRTMKFLNYARDTHYGGRNVESEAERLLRERGIEPETSGGSCDLLSAYRRLDRSGRQAP